MTRQSLQQCVADLDATGQLVRVRDPVSPQLEIAEIQRRVYRSGGPAVLFENVVGCQFPMLGNLFGTIERARFLFRRTLDKVRHLIELKTDPQLLARHPTRYLRALPAALHMRPRRRTGGPVFARQIRVRDLPQLQSWPDDGGAFITLPQVYSEDPDQPGTGHANLGMYRVQISGGQYRADEQVGLHYQIHRGIGVHHTRAIARRQPLPVNIFVGGCPAMTLAAVMPLPEGMSELVFAGALAGHRIPMATGHARIPVYADADFCISGSIAPDELLPEGPFGDHLGYYSLAHDFPVMKVDRVWCREDAIWPFTVVGRPPQEDTVFGQLIHELTKPVVPTVIPGVHAVHAVDAAGVHPLMLAIGSERYTPFQQAAEPRELLTQANAILGQGQMSLAKYLLIVNQQDDPHLDIDDIGAFFGHLLQRVDWARDVHFQTRTTVDTLDYSGSGLNQGSKVVIAAAGRAIRELPTEWPNDASLPAGFDAPRVCLPGILAVQGPPFEHQGYEAISRFCASYSAADSINQFPLVVVVDDSEFTARNLDNLLWVTFTRSDPATNVDGIDAQIIHKHWGCRGALIIDARIKPHHAPPLVEDPEITRKVDAMAARGGPLSKYL